MDRHTRKELEKERLRLAAKESLQLRAELLIPKNLSREELIKAAKEIDDNRAAKYVRKKPTVELVQKKLANEIIEAYNQIDKLIETVEVPIVEETTDEWDVKIGDVITYFDPELSYEITGYRPITKDKGLDFDPSLFTVAADTYRRTGRYTQLIPETFAHRTHWIEEFRRCRDGVTIGKYTLTGENYFFLNYFRLPSVLGDDMTEALEEDFPRFFAKQYEYFHYIAIARKAGLDVNVFKSRGIGFSLISASNVACAYTFHKATHNIVTAFNADYVSNTLDKVWQELDFLNTCTEGAFRRVRMKVDTALYKRASKIDQDKNETGWMAVIEGRVHDKPRKLRGARVYNLVFEECFDPDTVVIMSDYSRKKIKDIKIGDFVMGINGAPQEVVNTCSGTDEMFLVTQHKGNNYKVNSKHLLYLLSRPRIGNQPDTINLITCDDYLKLSDYNRRTTYGLKSPGLLFTDLCEIDPYFFGLWLGDGASESIELVVNKTDDIEIYNWITDYFNSLLDNNHHIKIEKNNSPSKKELINIRFSATKSGPKCNKLRNIFNSYNLINNKHIPKLILLTPLEYRLKVLAGLIDTDGNLKKGSRSYNFSYEIAMSRLELILQIAELARSCGFYCSTNSRVLHNSFKDGSISYRVCIRGDIRKIPVITKRKKVPSDYKLTTNTLSTSILVTPCGVGKYVGITLKSYGKDSDNLFLLDDYTIVHNCGSDPVLLDTYVQSRPLVDILGFRVGQRSTGGCVCAGTKVWTADNRYINIEDVTLNDKLIGFNNSVEPITYLQPESYKECVEVSTANGNIKCSVDHPLMTVVENHHRYHLEFKLANELKEGDHLVLSSSNNFGSVHEEHAYLLGSLLGDGNYSEGCSPTLSIGCEEQYNYFNSNYKIGISKLAECSTGIYTLAYFYNDVKELLKKYGMYGLSKERKQLPNNIYDWDKLSIAEFLAGYFDTDGNVLIVKKKHRSIKLTCKYKHLLEGISSLLSKFNIYCYILPELKKSSKPLISNVTKLIYNNEDHLVYVLYICNAVDILTFRDNIKLKLKYKQSRLDDYVTSGIKVSFRNSLKFKFNESNGKCKWLDGKELNNVRYTKIKKVEKIGVQRIYNLTALNTHSYVSGKFLSANTGGDASAALAGLKRIFYNPKAYQVLPYKNSYAKDGSVLYTGFFIPAYTLWFGKYDHRGVVDEDAAKAYYEKQWESIESPTDLLKDKAEYCFTPEDAFILEGDNRFDQEKLVEQLSNIELHKIVEKPKPASLIWPMKEGHVDRDARPTIDFNDKGKILIAELPITDDNGIAYSNLYCAGIDSIDGDDSTSTGQEDVSKFCIVVYRRQFGTMAPRPVAIYKDRPRDVRVAYDTALKLCLFYNCKALLEATRVSLKTYWQGFNKLNYLRHRPKATANTTTKTNLKQYGVPATLTIIDHQLDLISDYINDYCDLICYSELINELIRYSYANKRKFDMVAAFAMALLADEDMHGLVPKQRSQEQINEMAELRYYKNEYGQVLFGSAPKTNNYELFRVESQMPIRGYLSLNF